ncbi:MAG: IS3 family transposase [Ktedonobacteraceae bacterium]
MCRVLEVSESGFYAFLNRPLCQRKREDGVLAEHIQEIFETHRGVYGSSRIHDVLKDRGVHCGRKRVVRLMR